MTSASTTANPTGFFTLFDLGFEKRLLNIAFAMGLSLIVTVPAFFLDSRTFQGENVWIKPIKFQIALLIYFATLSFYANWLPKETLASPRIKQLILWVSVASVAEMIWIGGAAMFQTASHYNTSPIMFAIYGLMGIAAVLLTTLSLVLGVQFWRDKHSILPPALKLSVALGLICTFALTIPFAGTLSSMQGHFVGTPVTGETVPILGWSREVGDLRVPHFLATHALHFIPFVGLMAAWTLNHRSGARVVWMGTGAFCALSTFTFVQALTGTPFL